MGRSLAVRDVFGEALWALRVQNHRQKDDASGRFLNVNTATFEGII